MSDVTAVIIGPGSVEHLEPVPEALALDLAPADLAHLRGLFL
jgi:hypothetical protein